MHTSARQLVGMSVCGKECVTELVYRSPVYPAVAHMPSCNRIAVICKQLEVTVLATTSTGGANHGTFGSERWVRPGVSGFHVNNFHEEV